MISSTNLETQSRDGNGMGQLLLTEVDTTQLNTENNRCKMYETKEAYHLELIHCYKNLLWSKLREKITGLIPGTERILSKGESMRECANITEAQNTQSQFNSMHRNLSQNLVHTDCQLPCTQKMYKFELEYSHVNSLKGILSKGSSTSFYLIVKYKTLKIDERTEALVYDGVSFVAAAGGNLGLFLGFSLFSTLMYLLNRLQNFSTNK